MSQAEADPLGAGIVTDIEDSAPSPNNYEMIEKLGYLISLLSTVAPLQKNPFE